MQRKHGASLPSCTSVPSQSNTDSEDKLFDRRLEREQAEADLVKFLNQNHDVTTEEDLVGRDTDRSENGEAEARAGSLEASEKASEDELVENVAGSGDA